MTESRASTAPEGSVPCRADIACYDELVLTKPSVLVRLEGAAVLALSVFIYWQDQFSWFLFATFFLAPDLSMLGYLANVRAGAGVYNFVHTFFTPGVLLAIAILASKSQLLPFALIWIAHIGLDRMLGFGLKYPTRFKDTHLQHV